MSTRRQIISCGNCGTLYEVKGNSPRCPACNARYEDYEALPALPPRTMMGLPLEDPAFERDPEVKEPAAPMSEFIGAGTLLLSFIVMIAGAFMASPSVFLAGLAAMGLTIVLLSIVKLREIFTRNRKRDRFEGPDNWGWLFGRGFWNRW